MKLNTKVRYGLRSMIELAMNAKNTGLFQKEISERQNIPIKYLDKIIADLKSSGLIINVSGKRSGYILGDKPENITVYDIYKAFEGELSILQCLLNKNACDRIDKCASQLYWGDLNVLIIKSMQSQNLADLAIKQKKLNNAADHYSYDI